MSMYGKNHYNIVISLQLIKINEKKKMTLPCPNQVKKEEKKNKRLVDWLISSAVFVAQLDSENCVRVQRSLKELE